MSSRPLGSIAALAWGTHDFLAHFAGRRAGPVNTVLGVTSTIERVLKPLLDSLNGPKSSPAPIVPGVSSVHVYRSIAFVFKEPAPPP